MEGFSFFLVMVDRFSKYFVFIPVQCECPTKKAAKIFFNNVVKHFWMLEDIVSDRDKWFTDWFWVELFKMTGVKYKFSTAYHPQTFN